MNTIRFALFFALLSLVLSACTPYNNRRTKPPVWEPVSSEIELQKFLDKHPDINPDLINIVSHKEFKQGLRVSLADELFGPNVEQKSLRKENAGRKLGTYNYYGSRREAIRCYIQNSQIVSWEYMPQGVPFLSLVPSSFGYNMTVNVDVEMPGFTEVVVVDLNGVPVDTLCHKQMEAGVHSIDWEGLDWRKQRIPPGVYYIRANVGDWEQSIRIAFVK